MIKTAEQHFRIDCFKLLLNHRPSCSTEDLIGDVEKIIRWINP